MKLNDFNLNVIGRSEKQRSPYKLIFTEDDGETYFYTLTVSVEGMPVYFEIEVWKDQEVDLEWLRRDSKNEISFFKEVKINPTQKDQVEYLMRQSLIIHAKEISKLRHNISSESVMRLKTHIKELVAKNKEDFIKTYEDFIKNTPIENFFDKA